jgi:hypothetical protein
MVAGLRAHLRAAAHDFVLTRLAGLYGPVRTVTSRPIGVDVLGATLSGNHSLDWGYRMLTDLRPGSAFASFRPQPGRGDLRQSVLGRGSREGRSGCVVPYSLARAGVMVVLAFVALFAAAGCGSTKSSSSSTSPTRTAAQHPVTAPTRAPATPHGTSAVLADTGLVCGTLKKLALAPRDAFYEYFPHGVNVIAGTPRSSSGPGLAASRFMDCSEATAMIRWAVSGALAGPTGSQDTNDYPFACNLFTPTQGGAYGPSAVQASFARYGGIIECDNQGRGMDGPGADPSMPNLFVYGYGT